VIIVEYLRWREDSTLEPRSSRLETDLSIFRNGTDFGSGGTRSGMLSFPLGWRFRQVAQIRIEPFKELIWSKYANLINQIGSRIERHF
jgi:hypothetical protein